VARSVGIAALVAMAIGGAGGQALADTTPMVSLSASPRHIFSGRRSRLSGQVTGEPAGTPVAIYASPYPYARAPALVGSTTTGADGGFSFTVAPDRNTRYKAAEAGETVVSPSVEVDVIGRTVTRIRALPLGRAEIRLDVFHPRDLVWGRARVSWWIAIGRGRRFVRAPATRTVRLSRTEIELRTIVALPAGHFSWRACFHARGDHALYNPRRPPGCTGRGYHGGGYLPPGFPGPPAVARATAYLDGRIGRAAFAIVDSEGRLSGVNARRTFVSASVVKAMLLVAYLRRLNDIGQHQVDAYSNSFLYPMIHVSDNSAATQCWSIVGESGVYAVARAAGMTDFSIFGFWANAQISAADQARFFFEMDSLIPREFVGYARFLLSSIAGYESWGIPAVAGPQGYEVFFKGGWRTTGLGQLVHQVARLEGHGRRFAIAVMTDGDPTMQYGIETIQGVTAALLR
jgi:Beta-lactamase enzyme family